MDYRGLVSQRSHETGMMNQKIKKDIFRTIPKLPSVFIY